MSVLVELLKVALGNCSQLSGSLTAEEWSIILEEARRQAVVGVLLDGIERLPEDQRPQQLLLLQWIGECVQIEERNKLLNEAVAQLYRIFKNWEIRSCVLKGQGLARLYPNSFRRQSGDVDLWAEGGRRRVLQFLKNNLFKTGSVVIHHVDAEIIQGVETEVHFMPIWLYNPVHNHRLQRFFSEKSCEQFENYNTELGFCHSTVEFDVVYNLVHIFHHLLEEGIGLRHIIDYYYILKNSNGSTRSDIMKTIRLVGMNKFSAAMMWVLKEICGASNDMLLCKPNEKEGRWLFNEILVSGNFGHQRTDEDMHRNSTKRLMMMVKHYPDEVLWMRPWKLWHWCWRKYYRYN